MDSLAYFIAIISFMLAANAQWKLREYGRRIKELEEPIRQQKRDAALIAKAQMLAAEEESERKTGQAK